MLCTILTALMTNNSNPVLSSLASSFLPLNSPNWWSSPNHSQDALESEGHIVRLRFTTRKETIQNVERIVLSDENLKLKEFNGSTLEPHEQPQFVEKWKDDNQELLVAQLGSKNDGLEFLNGIFFVPSFAQKTVPHL